MAKKKPRGHGIRIINSGESDAATERRSDAGVAVLEAPVGGPAPAEVPEGVMVVDDPMAGVGPDTALIEGDGTGEALPEFDGARERGSDEGREGAAQGEGPLQPPEGGEPVAAAPASDEPVLSRRRSAPVIRDEDSGQGLQGRHAPAQREDGGGETFQKETGREVVRSVVARMAKVEEVAPSPLNPRKHFDPAKLEELAASVRVHGVLQPLVVRQHPQAVEAMATDERYEIVAGERRWRAARLAGLAEVPVRVIEIDDAAMLELMMIENLQRDDLTPLEEARGYEGLAEIAVRSGSAHKEAIAGIAGKIGKSAKYVYDRIRLLALVDEGQKLLDEGRITAGHAILIARQKPEDQEDLLDPDRHGGLWARDASAGDELPERDTPRHWGLKPVSVRELEHVIARTVRVDVEHLAEANPLLFGGVKAAVERALERSGKGKKLVHITHEHRCPEAAKADGEKTYGRDHWKPVGEEICEHVVLGLVVAGAEGYAESLDVCVAKDTCEVHWREEIRAKAKAAKQRDKESGEGGAPGLPGLSAYDKQQAKWKEEQEKREEQEKAWRAALPEVLGAVAGSLKKQTIATVSEWLLKRADRRHVEAACDLLGLPGGATGKKPEDVVRVLALAHLAQVAGHYSQEHFQELAHPFGGGIGAVVRAAKTAEPKEEKPSVQTSAPKAEGAKGRSDKGTKAKKSAGKKGGKKRVKKKGGGR